MKLQRFLIIIAKRAWPSTATYIMAMVVRKVGERKCLQ